MWGLSYLLKLTWPVIFFFSHVMKISRFPWKLKHKKRDLGLGLKGSLLNLWHIKWCLKYLWGMSFSKIYGQSRIRTPPPLPFYNPENGISQFQNQIGMYYLLWEVLLLMICMLLSEIKSLPFPKLCTLFKTWKYHFTLAFMPRPQIQLKNSLKRKIARSFFRSIHLWVRNLRNVWIVCC